MSNRHERRMARSTSRKKLARLKTVTLDQHFEDMLHRVRSKFEHTGEIDFGFECVCDGEVFFVPAGWPDRGAKGAVFAALRDSFRRRGVNRYVFASEAWVGKTPGLHPSDAPDRGECVQVIAVERNGSRRWAFAEITRNRGKATLGPWKVDGDAPLGWLLELLEEGYSDRAPKTERPPVGRLSRADFERVVDQHPEQAAPPFGIAIAAGLVQFGCFDESDIAYAFPVEWCPCRLMIKEANKPANRRGHRFLHGALHVADEPTVCPQLRTRR